MLFMAVERFKDGDPTPAYARFAERGRMLPDGIVYLDSWTTTDGSTCYVVLEAADRQALEPWIGAWRDLVDFEIQAILPSPEAAKRYGPDGSGVKP